VIRLRKARRIAELEAEVARLRLALADAAIVIGLQQHIEQGRQQTRRLDGPTVVIRPQARRSVADPTVKYGRHR
jgi:hypothetical protein